MKAQHTPTPFVVAETGSHTLIVTGGLRREAYREIAKAVLPEDAAFIVRAVNCHEELLEALKALTAVIRKGQDKLPLTVYEGVKKALTEKALTAIAKAEGR